METEEIRIQTMYAKRGRDPRYSWFNPSYLLFWQERERRFLATLEQHGFSSLKAKHILEIGCGEGYLLRDFIKWGVPPQNITGIDVLSDRVTEARRLCPEAVRLECGNAAKLPFSDATFDIVLQSTVFTSVLDTDLKKQIAAEMLRVVKEDGLVLWYDFHMNNPRNPDVQGVKKQEIFQLFPDCRVALQRITLAFPLVQLLAPYSPLACYLLEQVKVFNTHYLGVIRKPS